MLNDWSADKKEAFTDKGGEEVADIYKCKTLCRSIDDRKNKCVGEIARGG